MDGLRVVLRKLEPTMINERFGKSCDFCKFTDNDELLYGKIHELDKINAHYYCLLFACNLEQKGEDSQGILGFLASDIQKELTRAKTEICSYCSKPGATIICVAYRCRKIFHLPCGLKNGSLHHFHGRFQSFCKQHRAPQRIPISELMLPEAPQCAICLESVKRDPKGRGVVWAPCCKVNAWLHKLCVQKLALNAGYFFKCPRCNNKEIFHKAMLNCGIYIPEKDASWELEPNAFEDLLHRHDSCDASQCICPKGREHSVDDTPWEVILCGFCGSKGIHIGCLPAKNMRRKWYCLDCVPNKVPDGNNPGTSDNLRRSLELQGSQYSPPMKRIRTESSDSSEDEDVDIETDIAVPCAGRLVTKDGLTIPVLTISAPSTDSKFMISEGDLTWSCEVNERIAKIEQILLSDRENDTPPPGPSGVSSGSSSPSTIILDD